MMELKVFLPNQSAKKATNISLSIGLLVLIGFLVLRLHTVFIPLELLAALVIMLTIFYKEDISVSVSMADKTLTYVYKNLWGSVHQVIVYLPDAGGHYQPETFNKFSSGWRLLLYNGNYFRNRVSIQQKRTGFSKKQLDEIAMLVRECRKKI